MSQMVGPPDDARVATTIPLPHEIVRVPAGEIVALVHPLAERHPRAWNELRHHGPTNSPFDHHPPPPQLHPAHGITYLTRGPNQFTAALAEAYQNSTGGVEPIDRARNQNTLTLFELASDLELLDLDSGWLTRAGGNQAVCAGPRDRAREWARSIYAGHGVDGLAYRSSAWAPGNCVALWERGATAIPTAPLATRALTDSGLVTALANAAQTLHTIIV